LSVLDIERKLTEFLRYVNDARVHASCDATPMQIIAQSRRTIPQLYDFRWKALSRSHRVAQRRLIRTSRPTARSVQNATVASIIWRAGSQASVAVRIRSPVLTLLAVVFCAGAALTAGAEGGESKTGAQLFISLCASCHGEQARGDGPVASLLVTPPSDLTRLAQRSGGRFTADTVQRFIDGREVVRAHGPRDMPVWGHQLYFSAEEYDLAAREYADAQIAKIVEYLRSIQQP
jgi:mono/diheme cytochrome c family protein